VSPFCCCFVEFLSPSCFRFGALFRLCLSCSVACDCCWPESGDRPLPRGREGRGVDALLLRPPPSMQADMVPGSSLSPIPNLRSQVGGLPLVSGPLLLMLDPPLSPTPHVKHMFAVPLPYSRSIICSLRSLSPRGLFMPSFSTCLMHSLSIFTCA